jgi:hypothetical protein
VAHPASNPQTAKAAMAGSAYFARGFVIPIMVFPLSILYLDVHFLGRKPEALGLLALGSVFVDADPTRCVVGGENCISNLNRP